MSTLAIVIIAVLLLVVLGALAVLLNIPLPFGGWNSKHGQMHSLVSAQRKGSPTPRRINGEEKPGIFDTARVAKGPKQSSAVLTLQKKLKYAQWSIPPIAFRFLWISISVAAFVLASTKLNIVMSGAALLSGPILMGWLLNTCVDRRFKKFDKDYPQFLMSLVGLLKTGMTPMGALEAAAQGLDEGSLVKEECEIMLERTRFGVSEDKSVGSFGEDIYHPEIELFVQALLLSRRVGGALSDTLERLSRQVRKRQYFRRSAIAAVGMQRGSIAVIIVILAALELYIYLMYPELVVGAMKTPVGWQVWQFGILVILLGIFWVRQVTKIRV